MIAVMAVPVDRRFERSECRPPTTSSRCGDALIALVKAHRGEA
jgi:hypothetical protein